MPGQRRQRPRELLDSPGVGLAARRRRTAVRRREGRAVGEGSDPRHPAEGIRSRRRGP